MAAAAVLMSLDADRSVIIGNEDAYFADELEELRCTNHGYLTTLGRDVAKELRRRGILAGTGD